MYVDSAKSAFSYRMKTGCIAKTAKAHAIAGLRQMDGVAWLVSERTGIKMSDRKYAWCILRTANITEEEIEAGSVGEFTDSDIENMLKAYRVIDGAKVFISLEPLRGEDSEYPLIGWNDDVDEKMKMFFYYLEQDSFMGCYQDDFERFSKEWYSKEYEQNGCISFKPVNVEIIETVKPENEGASKFKKEGDSNAKIIL